MNGQNMTVEGEAAISGGSCQQLPMEDESNLNYSNCTHDQSKCTKVQGSKAKVVWTLKDMKCLIDLEALAGEAGCVVQTYDAEGKEILLRFYLDKFEKATKDDYQMRYLSLYVMVLKGGDLHGEGINLIVKVDRLTDSLTTHFKQLPETSVYIRTHEDRRGKLVEKYFLLYQRSPIPVITIDGRINPGVFELEPIESLNFGVNVSLFVSKTVHSTRPPTKEVQSLALDEVAASSLLRKPAPPLASKETPLNPDANAMEVLPLGLGCRSTCIGLGRGRNKQRQQ